jgi:ATP-dependent Clp protease ATP-binding subunit ClpA
VSATQLNLQTVTLQLSDELEHTLSHGFPTVSALGDKPGRGTVGLRAKARELLETDGACERMSLHRRVAGTQAVPREARLTLRPGANHAEWQQPVELVFDYLEWREEELWLGFVPALGLQVFANQPEQLAERVAAHARLVLVDSVKRVKLRDLAASQRARVLRLEEVLLTAKLKSPRQVEEAWSKTEGKKSVLAEVAVKWTRAATVAGFELEETVALMREVLESRQAGSVLLVGPPGVGKTSAARELARAGGLEVWSTSGSRLIAGQSGFGQWQERCRELCREAAKTRAVLHLGSLVELMEVGRHSANTQSIASFLRPWIARGEVLAIAECTAEQLAVIERTDPQLAAAFTEVRVAEPDDARTRRILEQVFRQLAKQADPAGSAAALDWLHRLHRRYATYSANPGRALRFLTNLIMEAPVGRPVCLTPAQVTAAFTRETGLPAVLLDDDRPLDLTETRAWFARRVIGQPAAVDAVADLLATIKARLNRPRQPLASLLFVGPTGTGKTELAKSIAGFLFGSASRLCRFDLSEFADAQAVRRLIGGSGEGEGLLTARVREQPFGVVLLDEFEKADPSFFDLLLQVLGDGRLTDAAGRVADFCNTVVIMTSNLGAREYQRGAVGFIDDRDPVPHFDEAARRFLRPEIYNRLGAVLGFEPLGGELMRQVTRRHLSLLEQRDGLRQRGVELRLADGVEEYLARRGHDPQYGARPLKRVLEAELVVPLAEALNEARTDTPLAAVVALGGAGLTVELKPRTDKLAAAAGRRATDLAARVVDMRRGLTRLIGGEAMSALENEVPVLAVLERRHERGQAQDRETAARLKRLRELRRTLDDGRDLHTAAELLETETLALYHAGGTPDETVVAAELSRLGGACQALRRTVFRLGFTQPDEIILALYGGNREWTLELARIYLDDAAAAGGRLAACEFVLPPPSRDATAPPCQRAAAADLSKPLAQPPGGWLGVLLHLRGELCYPKYRGEAGLHKHLAKGAARLCLIETHEPDQTGLAGYTPPAGIHRSGSVHEKAAKPRRCFHADEQRVSDDMLGDVVWARGEVAAPMLRLVEAYLAEYMSEIV